MKVAYLVLLAALAGCASGPSPEMIEHDRYIAQNRPLAIAGMMKWSVYYDGLYSRMLAAHAPTFALQPIVSLMRSAQELESGVITEDEFQHRRRMAQIEHQRGAEAAQQQAYAAQQQRQALGAAQVAAGMAMIQASQPTPQPYVAQQPSGNAYVTGYLRSNTVNGSLKYCNYSNGAVISVAAHQICPTSTQ